MELVTIAGFEVRIRWLSVFVVRVNNRRPDKALIEVGNDEWYRLMMGVNQDQKAAVGGRAPV
jgi:hypothetical protein